MRGHGLAVRALGMKEFDKGQSGLGDEVVEGAVADDGDYSWWSAFTLAGRDDKMDEDEKKGE